MLKDDVYGVILIHGRDGHMGGVTTNGHIIRVRPRACDKPGDWVWLSTKTGSIRRRMTRIEARIAQAESDSRLGA